MLPDTEPLLYVNISDGQNESNQLLDLDIFSGSVIIDLDGDFNFIPKKNLK